MNMKKATVIVGIVVGALLLGAVALGVLNAVFAGGAWSFGWNDYTYDDSGYSVGEGTLYATELTHIDLDWVDGRVEILACEDRYPSLSETCPNELTQESLVHWRISEDGKTLSVKYRASSKFLGSGENKNKNLILRVPKAMLGDLKQVSVHSVTASVVLSGISAERLEISSSSGVLLLDNCKAKNVSLSSVSGQIDASFENVPESIVTDNAGGETALTIPRDAGFSLGFETKRGGEPLLDFSTVQKDGRWICGDGKCRIDAKSVKGGLRVTYP